MAPKGRWGKKDAKPETKAAPVLPVRKIEENLPDAICRGFENFFTIEECDRYKQILEKEIEWEYQGIIVKKLDGTEIEGAEPRLTTFMSDEGICYEYSGRDNVGVGWHKAILEIKEKAENALEELGLQRRRFNSCQLNRYNGPRHALGMHADNEPDLERDAPIASVSFGATRTFRIIRRGDESQDWRIDLADGTFLVMGGEMQKHYLHGVPPGGDHGGLRFNLTFRICLERDPLDVRPRKAIPAPNRFGRNAGGYNRSADASAKAHEAALAVAEKPCQRAHEAALAASDKTSAGQKGADRAKGKTGAASAFADRVHEAASAAWKEPSAVGQKGAGRMNGKADAAPAQKASNRTYGSMASADAWDD